MFNLLAIIAVAMSWIALYAVCKESRDLRHEVDVLRAEMKWHMAEGAYWQ
ncbi:Uncharacterised protein [Corynebacterium renale]|nr:Uncharacterised protein [Corynebacterium renale]STD70267.1 Uncharacterised protein [Corynebacterium renale]